MNGLDFFLAGTFFVLLAWLWQGTSPKRKTLRRRPAPCQPLYNRDTVGRFATLTVAKKVKNQVIIFPSGKYLKSSKGWVRL